MFQPQFFCYQSTFFTALQLQWYVTLLRHGSTLSLELLALIVFFQVWTCMRFGLDCSGGCIQTTNENKRTSLELYTITMFKCNRFLLPPTQITYERTWWWCSPWRLSRKPIGSPMARRLQKMRFGRETTIWSCGQTGLRLVFDYCLGNLGG